jgi:hypothetical protein
MALPTDLGLNDAGFLLFIPDFAHLVRWNGTVWQFAPGDEGNGFTRDYLTTPPTSGWQLCDGSTTSMLMVGQATLRSQSIKLPDETSAGVYHKSGTLPDVGQVRGPVAPTLSGNTADESAHTHSVDPPNTTSTTPSTNTTGTNSANETVDKTLAGATVTVAKDTHTHDMANHTHDVNIASFASAAGSAHHHGVGTLAVSTTGEPKNVIVMRYFRR